MSEIRYVLDASAVLALVHGERGADRVESCMDQGAAICAVNLSEVVAKCAELGLDAPGIVRFVKACNPSSINHTS